MFNLKIVSHESCRNSGSAAIVPNGVGLWAYQYLHLNQLFCRIGFRGTWYIITGTKVVAILGRLQKYCKHLLLDGSAFLRHLNLSL